jgi:phosphoserine phosphatase RsbU/P
VLSPSHQPSARILIVDDDDATRAGLTELLQGYGYECSSAATFQEALDILKTNPPDVLIADVRLREYNGLHLVIKAPPTVRTVIVTGFHDPVLEAEATRHGAAHMVKPIDPARLKEVIGELLNRNPGPRSSSGLAIL